MAMADPANKDNAMLLHARDRGLPHASTFHTSIPEDGAKFLKEYGNAGNDNVTKKTILECFAEAPKIEQAWERRKRAMSWTIASLTYPVHEIKKW
eukprot:2889976-Pyramimonas_sp.AAC.1